MHMWKVSEIKEEEEKATQWTEGCRYIFFPLLKQDLCIIRCSMHTIFVVELVRNCCKHIINEFPALVNYMEKQKF